MNKRYAITRLQNHLLKTLTWLTDWRITINLNKSVSVLFGHKTHYDAKCLVINSYAIKWNTSVKYLSITIDAKLKFSQHVNSIYNKARDIHAALYPMLNNHSPLPLKHRHVHRNYFNLCRPYLVALISDHQWKRLEAILNIALGSSTATP